MSAARTCRACGCTDSTPCVTSSGPCHWVEPTLCSACERKELVLQEPDLDALLNAPPLAFELTGTQAMILLSTLQLAIRHPQFDRLSSVSELTFSLANALAQHVSLTPNLSALVERGWRRNEEPARYSRLILPSNPQ